jgi:hypothetical protein
MIRIVLSALARRKGVFLCLALVSAVGYFWKREKVDKEAIIRATLDRMDRLSKNVTTYGVDIVSVLLMTSWIVLVGDDA